MPSRYSALSHCHHHLHCLLHLPVRLQDQQSVVQLRRLRSSNFHNQAEKLQEYYRQMLPTSATLHRMTRKDPQDSGRIYRFRANLLNWVPEFTDSVENLHQTGCLNLQIRANLPNWVPEFTDSGENLHQTGCLNFKNRTKISTKLGA